MKVKQDKVFQALSVLPIIVRELNERAELAYSPDNIPEILSGSEIGLDWRKLDKSGEKLLKLVFTIAKGCKQVFQHFYPFC